MRKCKPKMEMDQVPGGFSVPCKHASPFANALWEPCSMVKGQIRSKVMVRLNLWLVDGVTDLVKLQNVIKH